MTDFNAIYSLSQTILRFIIINLLNYGGHFPISLRYLDPSGKSVRKIRKNSLLKYYSNTDAAQRKISK